MDYRKFYEKEVCIIPKNFIIHHLDFDRKNNNLSNLLMLPKELHNRYHFYKNLLENQFEMFAITESDFIYNVKKYTDLVKKMEVVLIECSYWQTYKTDILLRKESDIK